MDLNVMRDNFNETFLAALVAAQFLIPLDCFSQILDPFSIPLAPAADAVRVSQNPADARIGLGHGVKNLPSP